MAECRRVELTTLSCDGLSATDKAAAALKCPSGAPQMHRAAGTGTVRLEVTLFESNERSFPEFSYSQLVDNEIKHDEGEDPFSRLEEEEKKANQEATALSKKYEDKYGGKAKKKDRIQDLIDIGYGYDDEDSFIDNSEAYDEFVPASITTKFGGFYVNSGTLQFCQASDMEDVMTENTPEPPKEKPKKKQCREGGEMKSTLDSMSSTSSKIGPDETKKKKAPGTLSVTSMLKKFQREKEKERQKMEKANQRLVAIMSAPTAPLCPADAAGGGGSGVTDPLLTLIGSTNDHALIQAANAVDFDIDLESLLDVSEGTLSPKLVPQPVAEMQLFHPNTDDPPQAPPPNTNFILQLKPHSEQIQFLRQTSSSSPHGCVPLPEGLPPGLEDNIGKLMAAAKISEGESKLKFFTPEINSILLDIELLCREQGGQLRSKVFTHLSSFLPCSKDTLLRRVRKLLDKHIEPPDVEDPMHKLKEAIGKAMPEQIRHFHEKCQVYEQVKASKATEEEKEGKQKVNAGPADNVEEKGGKRGGPKKLFKWNEEMRECLCLVLRLKMERYKKEKGSQQLEEYLKTLLDGEVKPLWPKGWMQSRVLVRESRTIFDLFTSLPVKRARPEKKQSSISDPSIKSDGCSTPPMKGLPPEATNVLLTEGSDVSNSLSFDAVMEEAPALRQEESKRGGVGVTNACSSTPGESDQPLVTAPYAPTHSLLDLLADQALAQEQPLSASQELITEAVMRYQRSAQHWSMVADTKSPLPPPPPPQSSPVGFPASGVCQGVLPHQLQIGDFARCMDAGQVIPDDADITNQ